MRIGGDLLKLTMERIRSGLGTTPDLDTVRRYDLELFGALVRLDASLIELEQLAIEIRDAKSLISALLKLKCYHVFWISLHDQLAQLVNVVYALGRSPGTLNLVSLVRGDPRVDTRCRKLWDEVLRERKSKRLRKERNILLHQGVFDATKLEAAWDKCLTEELRGVPAADTSFSRLLIEKCVEIHEHLDYTRDFLTEFLGILHERAREV